MHEWRPRETPHRTLYLPSKLKSKSLRSMQNPKIRSMSIEALFEKRNAFG
jgi:hypothetical protein